MKTLPLAEARNRLSALIDEVSGTHETIMITRNGVPAAVVVSAEDYESVLETLALAANAEDRARLAEAEESVQAGDVLTGDEMDRLVRARILRERGHGAA